MVSYDEQPLHLPIGNNQVTKLCRIDVSRQTRQPLEALNLAKSMLDVNIRGLDVVKLKAFNEDLLPSAPTDSVHNLTD